MKIFVFASVVLQAALACAVNYADVEELRPGRVERAFADGSKVVFDIVTDYPRVPGAKFVIRERKQGKSPLVIRVSRRPYWKNAEANMREFWVETVKKGAWYELRRAFAVGDEVSFRFDFDHGGCPWAKSVPESEKVWSVVYGDSLSEDDARRASLGAKLPGKVNRFALDADERIDLARFKHDFDMASKAVVQREIVAPSDGVMTFGVAVDWFFTAYVNGEKAATSLPGGNRGFPFSAYDHVFQVKVRKGVNRMAFHVSPGCDGWTFLCRTFPDRAPWDVGERERAKMLAAMFPAEVELAHAPWVTALGTTGVRIGAALSAPGKFGVRCRPAGSEPQTRWAVSCGLREDVRGSVLEFKDLPQATRCDYDILTLDAKGAKEKVLASGSFTTHPAAPEDFTFHVVGDTQFDGPRRVALLRDAAANCGIAKGRFLVSVGDVDNTFDDFAYSYHETFTDEIKRLCGALPLVLVRGNHEYHGTEACEFPKRFGRPYYSFTCGDAFFFVIDTGDPRGGAGLDAYLDEQRAWLARETASEACRKAKYRIMLAHATPFEFESRANARNVARVAADAFYGENPGCRLDLWICGDVHQVYRWDPHAKVRAGRPRPVGAKPVTKADIANVRFPVAVNDGPNAGNAKQTVMRVEVTRGGIKVTTMSPDGKTIDSFTARSGKPLEVHSTIYAKY